MTPEELIYCIEQINLTLKELCRKIDVDLKFIDIQEALCEICDCDESGLVLKCLSANKMLERLRCHDFNYLKFEALEVVVLEESILPPGIPIALDEQIFKRKGQVWEIHKTDKDFRPSNPHAHNRENGYKLDLSNGDLFKKTKYVGSIRKKELMLIRDKVKQVSLPALRI
jgi:hypothetical protein